MDYVYLCPKCNVLIRYWRKDALLTCLKCKRRFLSMHLSTDEWSNCSDNKRSEIIANAKHEERLNENPSKQVESANDKINSALAKTHELVNYVDDLRIKGIDLEPPRSNDETLLIPINCWFDKKFFISLYLLRYHEIAGIKISYHEMPQLQIKVKKSNLELIVQASSMTTLQGGVNKYDNDWEYSRGSKSTTWVKDYTYLDTYNHIYDYHPYYSYKRPMIDPSIDGLSCGLKELDASYINSANVYLDWEKGFRNTIYSQAIKEYGKMAYNSEYRLYYFVKFVYPDAIFQYHADWLGQQSLDIFIPSINCGIEYQGEQHYKAVDYFGGDEKLKLQQEMDYEKKMKCTKHGVKLFQWPYDRWITETEIIKHACIWFPGDYSWITHEYLLNNMSKMCPKTVEEFLSSIQMRRADGKKEPKLQKRKAFHTPTRLIRKYNTSGEYIKDYLSFNEAARDHNITPVVISKACNGKQKTAAGFQWRVVKYGSNPDNISPVEYDTVEPGKMRPVVQIDENGVIIQRYESISSASRSIGVSAKSIRSAANGVQKRAAGFYWMYVD